MAQRAPCRIVRRHAEGAIGMSITRLILLLVTLPLLAACPDNHISCATNDDCLQGRIAGTCLPSPLSETMWCGFPDPGCESGLRWGVKTGDGLAGECVEGEPPTPDAGPDAMIDATNDTTAPTLVST